MCIEHSLHLSRRGDASPPLEFAFLLAPNASTKRYHQTQALMGATRLASGIFSAVSCCVGFFSSLVLHRRLKQRLTDRRVISAVCEPLFYMYEHSLHLSRRGDASPPLEFAFLLAPNASTKRYHQTQALMGATRLASGIFSAVSCCVGFFSSLVLHRRLKQRLTDRRVISAVCEPLFYMYEHSLHLSRRGDASPPLVFAFLLAPNARPNATTKRKL